MPPNGLALPLSSHGDHCSEGVFSCRSNGFINEDPARSQNRLDFRSAADVVTEKRDGYLSWDEYFLAVAVLSSKRSKDPYSPTGACIVDSNQRVVGIGYNGFPRGCEDDWLPWAKPSANNDGEWLHTQEPFVVHAVTNAILNKCSDSVEGCRLYVMRFPCNECAKVIIQSQIREVVVLQTADSADTADEEDSVEVQGSKIMLAMAGVNVRYYRPGRSSVLLNFVSGLAPNVIKEGEVVKDSQKRNQDEEKMNKNDGDNESTPSNILGLLNEEAKGFDPTNDSINIVKKRDGYISWDDYFMAMAFLTAQRSKDPNTQVGACIVDYDQRMILGLGYNGFPRGCSDDDLPWAKGNKSPLHNKYMYVCHAEVNAIMNKCSANVRGATLFVAMFPCENCAKMIIQAGIREVVFMSNPYADTDGCRASRIMFSMAGIKLRQHIPSDQQLQLDFVPSKPNE